MKQTSITVISRSGIFESLTALLFDKEYSIHLFPEISAALGSEEISISNVVLLDTPQPEAECRRLFSRIRRKNSHCRIIAAWTPGDAFQPELIPSVFQILRKPVSAAKLKDAVIQAAEADCPFEARRELRMPAELQMDLITDHRILKMETRNVSLHGMQAAWGYEWGFNEAREIAQSQCRIYFGKWIKKFIQVPVRFCYAAGSTVLNKSMLLGFEFGEMDSRKQEILYRVAGCKKIW